MLPRDTVGRFIPSGLLVWMTALAFGAMLMLPELVTGTIYNFSLRYNLVWGDQAIALMRDGILYPRWLPQSWDGMGSPTFYFYSPLFFIASGLFGVLGMSTQVAMSLASLAFIALSGVAMNAFLRTLASPRAAFAGMILYLLAPYRLHDIYTRGALAEATTYAAIPLILLALKHIGAGRRNWGGVLAIAYALLIFGHLPVALLASVTIIPAYALYCVVDGRAMDWRAACVALFGGVGGLALSAIFLVPALSLLPAVSSDELFNRFFSPDNFYFFTGPNSVFGPMLTDNQIATVALATGYGLIALLALVFARDVKGVPFWAVLGLISFGMVSGLLPFVWDIPVLQRVQFPSRLLAVIEPLTVVLLVLCWGRIRPLFLVFPVLLIAGGSFIVFNMAQFRIGMTASSGAAARANIFEQYRDAAEFLPQGYPLAFDDQGRADPSFIRLPQSGIVQAVAKDMQVSSVIEGWGGSVSLTIDSASEGTISLRRFHFPHWQVKNLDTGALVQPKPDQNHLVSWTVPSGRHRFRLESGWAPLEWQATLLSLFALLVISVWLGLATFRASWLTRR